MFYDLAAFGLELKRIRQSLKISQSTVKKEMGIHEDTLRKLELGKSMPKIETLDLLSHLYKQDISLVFNQYKHTPESYINKKMDEVLPLVRNLAYSEIKKLADDFYEHFSESKYSGNTYLKNKMNQFNEYLNSLHNLENSFVDESRNDITLLINSMNLTLADILNNKEAIHLDKLEIRIFILLGVIYRYRNELNHCKVFLEIALRELNEKHSHEADFVSFHLTIVYNLMTYYHRIDDHETLEKVYKDSLNILEQSFNINLFSGYLIRAGINRFYLNDDTYNHLVNTGLSLLVDIDYKDRAERHRKALSARYPFLDL